jgi:hypothetical protein
MKEMKPKVEPRETAARAKFTRAGRAAEIN